MSNERDHSVSGQSEDRSVNSGTASRSVVVKEDRIDSRALFGTTRQITIEHGTDAYILRLTAQNKLILTK